MSTITFEIPGTPVAKQSGSWGNGHMYTKDKSRNYESLVIDYASEVAPETPIEGPVVLQIIALFPRKKDLLFKYKRTGEYKHPTHRLPFPQRPDFDNVSKPICDGITRAGVWVDDKQVYEANIEMYYCAIGEKPGTQVIIEWED